MGSCAPHSGSRMWDHTRREYEATKKTLDRVMFGSAKVLRAFYVSLSQSSIVDFLFTLFSHTIQPQAYGVHSRYATIIFFLWELPRIGSAWVHSRLTAPVKDSQPLPSSFTTPKLFRHWSWLGIGYSMSGDRHVVGTRGPSKIFPWG